MNLIREYLDQLATADRWTYRASSESAAEPAAWAAMALAAHGRSDAAAAPSDWLAGLQRPDGSVGVTQAQEEPRWPTSLALLAWCTLDGITGDGAYRDSIGRAAQWCLSDRGKIGQRSPQIGHDPTLVGWSWAANTATWLEPTCYFVMGLDAAGFGDHPRVAEGRRAIADRFLPTGGANYGNTIVLGQPLLAHLAPTGVALAALTGRELDLARVERSIELLLAHTGPDTTPISLAWACLGLTARGRRPSMAEAWIEQALGNEAWQPLAAYERSLLLLAARPTLDWLPGNSPSTSRSAIGGGL
jgi:hypothetical protein